jgi:hypothetical protein
MYKAPVEEIAFTLKHVAGLGQAIDDGLLGDLGEDLVDAILSEAGRFASDEIAPLGETGDRQGARIIDGVVTTPDGWRDLYKSWISGGWNGLTASEEFGGQALPHMLNVAALEMWNSGSMAFALCPTLTMGAIEAVATHGSDALKATYLPKLVSGEWTGTMNLTEPHAGSDLGVLKARAERATTAAIASLARRSSSPGANTTSRTTSSIWCSPACRTRRPERAVSRCFSCRSFWSMTTARSAPATISSPIRSNTSSASTARPPAR